MASLIDERNSLRLSQSAMAASTGVLGIEALSAGPGHQTLESRFSSKRLFDVLAALLLLLLALPLLVTLACLILAERDKGSIFFAQRRIGRNGKEFPCLKLRSMCPDADQRLKALLLADEDARLEWETTRKLKVDPRITRVGGFLRLTSLDELPQLWNVVRGDMSLVGPRPITRAEIDGPYVWFNGAKEYLSVRPGITGLWQVSGRSLTTYEDRVALDRRYVSNATFFGDLKILFRTVGVVVFRHGAC